MGASEILAGIGTGLTGVSNTLANYGALQERQKTLDLQREVMQTKLEASKFNSGMQTFNQLSTLMGNDKKLGKAYAKIPFVKKRLNGMFRPDVAEPMTDEGYNTLITTMETSYGRQSMTKLMQLADGLRKGEYDPSKLPVGMMQQMEDLRQGDMEKVFGLITQLNDFDLKSAQVKETRATTGLRRAQTKKALAEAATVGEKGPKATQRRALISKVFAAGLKSGEIKVDPFTGQVVKGQRLDQIISKANTMLKAEGFKPITTDDPEIVEAFTNISRQQFEAGEKGKFVKGDEQPVTFSEEQAAGVISGDRPLQEPTGFSFDRLRPEYQKALLDQFGTKEQLEREAMDNPELMQNLRVLIQRSGATSGGTE